GGIMMLRCALPSRVRFLRIPEILQSTIAPMSLPSFCFEMPMFRRVVELLDSGWPALVQGILGWSKIWWLIVAIMMTAIIRLWSWLHYPNYVELVLRRLKILSYFWRLALLLVQLGSLRSKLLRGFRVSPKMPNSAKP